MRSNHVVPYPKTGPVREGEQTAADARSVSLAKRPPYLVAAVDDDTTVLSAVRYILRTACEFQSSGCYVNGEDAIVGTLANPPHVALIDVRLPKLNGIELTRELRRRIPELIIVMMSALDDRITVEKAIQAGCHGYITKPFSSGQCLAALRCAIWSFFSPIIDLSTTRESQCLVRNQLSQCCPQLDDREQKALLFLAQGDLYKEVAERLEVSNPLVHKILNKVFRKLCVDNRSDAVVRWQNCRCCWIASVEQDGSELPPLRG